MSLTCQSQKPATSSRVPAQGTPMTGRRRPSNATRLPLEHLSRGEDALFAVVGSLHQHHNPHGLSPCLNARRGERLLALSNESCSLRSALTMPRQSMEAPKFFGQQITDWGSLNGEGPEPILNTASELRFPNRKGRPLLARRPFVSLPLPPH